MGEGPRFRDVVVFQSTVVRIGAFRCDADHARFRQSGPVRNHCVWFSRTPVVIQPECEPSFVANQNTATFYNRAQSFSRTRVGASGDDSDWFAVDESLACHIVDAYGPCGTTGRAGPFPWSHVAIDSAAYFRQRQLFEVATSTLAPNVLAIEEAVIQLVERAIARASSSSARGPLRVISSRHRDLVHDVELLLSGEFDQALSLANLARRVGTSVYHLCRVFRRVTGSTMHQYRQRLRLRAALEAVTRGQSTLTEVAVGLGFPSHSHFTNAFRLEFGILPSALRRLAPPPSGGPTTDRASMS
jgi:AraC-like DNA-binding protein